jgi:hypothetical protein
MPRISVAYFVALLVLGFVGRTKLKLRTQILSISALTAYLCSPFVRDVIVAKSVLKNPTMASALVTGKIPALTGNMVDLAYSAENKSCGSWAYADEIVGSPAYEQIRTFQRIPIAYSREYPCAGIPGDPPKSLAAAERRLTIAVPALVLLAVALWLWGHGRR